MESKSTKLLLNKISDSIDNNILNMIHEPLPIKKYSKCDALITGTALISLLSLVYPERENITTDKCCEDLADLLTNLAILVKDKNSILRESIKIYQEDARKQREEAKRQREAEQRQKEELESNWLTIQISSPGEGLSTSSYKCNDPKYIYNKSYNTMTKQEKGYDTTIRGKITDIVYERLYPKESKLPVRIEAKITWYDTIDDKIAISNKIRPALTEKGYEHFLEKLWRYARYNPHGSVGYLKIPDEITIILLYNNMNLNVRSSVRHSVILLDPRYQIK